MFLVPRLYGKIEPLLGMEPRTEKTYLGNINFKTVIVLIVGFALALVSQMAAESGMTLIEWEFAWAESFESIIFGIFAAAVLAVVALLVLRRKQNKVSE